MLEIASKCIWIGEITLQIAGKSKLVRFGPWKNYRQRPIILHIVGKCKLTCLHSRKNANKGEICWELPANASGQGKLHSKLPENPNQSNLDWKIYWQRPIILHIASKCQLNTFGLWKKFEQREIPL